MKSRAEVERRLEKLRTRYLRDWMRKVRGRRHTNCVHNREFFHSPVPRPRKERDELLIPHHQVTLVVLHPDEPETVRLCAHGMEDPDGWNGDVCDSDEVSRACSRFRPSVTEADATDQFNKLLSNDKFVLRSMPDVAALQWVLGQRVYSWPTPWWVRLGFWVSRLFWRSPKLLPTPPAAELPKDLWDDPPSDP